MTYDPLTHILFCKMYYIWRHKKRNTSLPFFVSVSLIDRRGFLPEDESVQTAAADIELPTVATKSEINVVGGSSQLAFGLQESPSVVPVYPNSHHNSSSAWQKPCCLPLSRSCHLSLTIVDCTNGVNPCLHQTTPFAYIWNRLQSAGANFGFVFKCLVFFLTIHTYEMINRNETGGLNYAESRWLLRHSVKIFLSADSL